MSSRLSSRARVLAALNDTFRQLSSVTIFFHQAIADRLGLSLTDHKCAGILCETGPITAGELGERASLTTGAVTGVIDRLEAAGFARRAKDPNDRRKVIVEPIPERIAERIAPLFEGIGRASMSLCEDYGTKDLAMIHEFLVRACGMTQDQTRALREERAVPSGKNQVVGKTRKS